MKKRTSGYSLIELIAAIFVLSIVFTSFYGMVHGIIKIKRGNTAQLEALAVLSNFIEQYRVAPERGIDAAEAILNSEFKKSSLSQQQSLAARCETTDGGLKVGITRNASSFLAVIDIKE